MNTTLRHFLFYEGKCARQAGCCVLCRSTDCERALALLQKKARKAGRGAELICDESTAATSCPCCGNPTVVPNVSLTY